MAGITLRLFVFQVPASYVNSLVRSRPVTSTALSLVSLLECKRSPRPQRRSVPAVTSPRRWDPVLGYCFDFWFDFGIFVFIKPDSKRTMLSNILRTLARTLCGSSEGTNLESARAGTGTEGHGAASATSESAWTAMSRAPVFSCCMLRSGGQGGPIQWRGGRCERS